MAEDAVANKRNSKSVKKVGRPKTARVKSPSPSRTMEKPSRGRSVTTDRVSDIESPAKLKLKSATMSDPSPTKLKLKSAKKKKITTAPKSQA